MNPSNNSDIIEVPSTSNFAQTLERLVKAIEGAGLIIFARIDHAAGARDAGLSMPPAIVLIYGHPKGGTPIMIAAPQAALDLPLRVLVREDAGGRVYVSFHPIGPMLRQLNVSEALANKLEPAQRLLIEGIAP
jgi:uncharacterized protein (DUF302 family)